MEYCPWYLIHILVTKHPQQQMTDPDISQQIINNNEDDATMTLFQLCVQTSLWKLPFLGLWFWTKEIKTIFAEFLKSNVKISLIRDSQSNVFKCLHLAFRGIEFDVWICFWFNSINFQLKLITAWYLSRLVFVFPTKSQSRCIISVNSAWQGTNSIVPPLKGTLFSNPWFS